MKSLSPRIASLLVVAFAMAALPSAFADTFVVNSTADVVDASPGDGPCATAGGACTLRAAIMEANAQMGLDTIVLPAGEYTIGIDQRDEEAGTAGDFDVIYPLEVTGAGPDVTIIDGANLDRVFDAFADLEISGMTIRNGNPGLGFIFGGAVLSDMMLTLTDVAILGCSAGHGGAIASVDGGSIDLVRVSLTNNDASVAGGAIESDGTSTATLTNVTISSNSGGFKGGIANDGNLTLVNVTMHDNELSNSSTATAKGSIFSTSGLIVPCAGTMPASFGYNIDSGASCGLVGTGDVQNTDPLLGALADDGDGTYSHALLPGSPAIDAVPSCPPPADDQRGVARPIDGDMNGSAECDAGAFELGGSVGSTTTTIPSGSTTTTTVSGSTTTTTLQVGCLNEASLSSATCRIGELSKDTQAAAEPGRFADKLVKFLTKSTDKIGAAEEAVAIEKNKKARRQVSKARKFMRRYGKKTGSGKGAKTIVDDATRADLQARATDVTDDLTTVRDSLR